MRMDLVSLHVDRLIVHEVPKKFSKVYSRSNPDLEEDEIILSEIPTEFDSELVGFFYERIASTIGSSSAFDIELDPQYSNNMTQIAIREYFEFGNKNGFPLSDDESIRITQNIAKSLHDVQTARNPGGILLFIPCHNQSQHGIAILKVEREAGVRILREKTTQGKFTFNAQHIRDLMLTSKTKLFKIVLFYSYENEISGIVCDQQQGTINNRDVADFFLTGFLGCKLKTAAYLSTKDFYEAVTNYINSGILTDSEKLDVRTHLISEISDNSLTLNVLSFAQRAIPTGKIQGFMELMNAKGISSTFQKDCSLIFDRVSKVKYEFECGIKLTGTEEAMKEKLRVIPSINGSTKFEITDHLKRVD
ncbi:MAG: nucleoid-associated protein [Christensenella sp.]|nr:nucleoid-associated protein [Christensenella sp.]